MLDITFERSNIISRKLTGTIASEVTLIHWIKHYVTQKITKYQYSTNKLTINLLAKKTIFEDLEEEKKYLEPIIKDDLMKWLPKNIREILKNNDLKKKFDVEFKIKWDETSPSYVDFDFYRNIKKYSKEDIQKLVIEFYNKLLKNK